MGIQDLAQRRLSGLNAITWIDAGIFPIIIRRVIDVN
jgi:hypothetical protein